MKKERVIERGFWVRKGVSDGGVGERGERKGGKETDGDRKRERGRKSESKIVGGDCGRIRCDIRH